MHLVCVHGELEPVANISRDAESSAVLHVAHCTVHEVARGLVVWVFSTTAFVSASLHRLQIPGWPPITFASEYLAISHIEPFEARLKPGCDTFFASPHLATAQAILHALAARLVGHAKCLA